MFMFLRTLMTLALMAGMSSVSAETALTLRDAAQKAIATSPEVEARWHAFLAADEEQGVARGGFLPRVDLSANLGRQRLDSPSTGLTNLTRSTASLTLSQMLYDGQTTRREIERLGFAKRVRFYEVLDAVENTALEATRAYLDVLRYRDLVAQARENYVQHRLVFDRIEDRFKKGVGRGVDLDVAKGRLALAESNLLTETTNLHDVSARYQRIVGELPGEPFAQDGLSLAAIPGKLPVVLHQAYRSNPALNASTEGIRIAQAELHSRDASMRPRVDLRARNDVGNNIDGVRGNRTDQVVELVFNYNLFRGGSDVAAKRQYAERLNQARDMRDKTCRDVRQTLAIAHNDITRLEQQLVYLSTHKEAISKARLAYRQQFETGRRTLLDLLDIQNEFFQASRAHSSAQYDLQIARGRTLAGMGRILPALQISRDALPMSDEADPTRAGDDPMLLCPPEGPEMLQIDKQALLDEAVASGIAIPGLRPAAPDASAEVAAKPAAPAVPATAPALAIDEWYAQQNPDDYVIQIISVKNSDQIDDLIESSNLKECHRFDKMRDGEVFHVLTCGLHQSRTSARNAVKRLMKGRLAKGKPFPYRIGDIVESVKSSETTKPAETTKPVEAANPADAAKPTVAVQPAEAAQPAEAVKPVETEKPAEAAKPAEPAQPEQAPQ